MALRSWFLFAVASSLLLAVSQAVVWGPRQSQSRGRSQIEPTVVEIADSSEQTLLDAAEKAIDPSKKYRERRQSNPIDSVGYTYELRGDPHTFALVHWTGYPSEHLFILTRRRTRASGYRKSDQSWLWRSKDYGHTFVNDTVKWANDTVIEWYYISPFSEYLIFADIINNRLYITFDEGDTYNRTDIPFQPDRLTFQSRYANHSTEQPYNHYVLGYDSANHSLWVSVNLGVTWRKLSDNVVEGRYYWRRMDTDQLGAVYFEKNITERESQLYIVRDVSDASSQPELFDPDLGKFMRNTFVMELEYMFVQKNDSGQVQQRYSSPLWVSHNREMFSQAKFPLRTEEKHYSVVDASEGQVFIAVYHDINNTNLYLSEEKGLNYSLSLQYIISPPESDWLDGYPRFDVHVVEGIVGTYVANKKAPGSTYGASVISYDKGGEWVRLIPPAVDSSGRPTICVPPGCSLHLHMDSDTVNGYQSILSQDSAVGLLMALGNLGTSLSGSRSAVRLYFSRDGGFTWFEVGTGFWEFQFAALGSVVVAVKKRVSTSTIQWSCDEGHTWEITDFSQTGFGIYVIGMLTEREEKARHVTIFGYNYSRREWLIVDLNFTSVVPNQCVEEDYFDWLPSDDRPGSRCLLGEVITYERRNASYCCYIDPQYDRPVSRAPCYCTIEDFECDFGFERLSLNSPCTPLSWIQWPPPPPDYCSEGLNYTISSGYRKVAGDKCIKGTETYFFELVRECPVLPPQGLYLRVQGQPDYVPGHIITFQLQQFAGWKQNTWYLWNFNDTTLPINITGFDSASTQSHTFSQPGKYRITVQAGNRAGASVTVLEITVYDSISSVNIPYIATVRAGGQPAMAMVYAWFDNSQPYRGPLSYRVVGENEENFTDTISTETQGSVKVSFMPSTGSLSTSRDIQVTFVVWNPISNKRITKSVGVVVIGDYVSIWLKFPVSSLPTNYNSSQWMDTLKAAIVKLLMSEPYKLQNSQVEIESTQVMLDEDNSPETSGPVQRNPQHRILRQSDNIQEKLFVNVNILPLSASVENITSAKTVSSHLASGLLVVTVGEESYTAETEFRITDHIIIDPGQRIVVTNWKLYSSIGGGLGAVLILGIATAVVLGLIIYYYRRRYNRLRVRYSRLSQAPVRFTFTQSGEVMEEDDPDINAQDTTCAETDDDEQPLKKKLPL